MVIQPALLPHAPLKAISMNHFRPARSSLSLAIAALLAPCLAIAADTTPASTGTDATAAMAAPTLDAIQVRGEHIPEPMLLSSQVVNLVSRQDMDRQGASTAADALGRVAGMSVSQGKYVIVRGLNERYSQALLNGSPLPSPEPLKRVVPLDLFPTNVLDTIDVQKTYSARYPGEFGGGVINLSTAVIPQSPFLKLSYGISGNSETTTQPGLTYYGGGDSDLLGFDDGTRKARGAFAQALASGQMLNVGEHFSREQMAAIGAAMPNAAINLLQTSDSINPNHSGSIAGGTTLEFAEDSRLGVVASAALSNSWKSRNGVQQYGEARSGTAQVLSEQTYLSTSNEARLNGLLALTWEIGKHTLGASTLYVHDTEKQARSREGFTWAASQVRRNDATRWIERELLNHQFTGKHVFGQYDELTINWRGGHARASRQSPFEREINYFQDEYGHWRHLSNNTSMGDVNERIDSAAVDVDWRLPSEREMILSAGYAWSDTQRDARTRDFSFLITDTAPFYNAYQRPDYLFSDYNLYQGYLELRENTGANGASAYDAGLKTDAAYLELESQLAGNVRATAGLRWEKASQHVSPVNLFTTGTTLPGNQLDNDYLLPALSLTWNFADNLQLRLAASQTIARPQFRELSPLQYLDLELDRMTVGNPYLMDTEMTNLDARLEWYFNNGEYFHAGVFAKQLDKPIEAVVSDDVSFLRQSFVNAPEATLYGLELDFRKYFSPALSWLGDRRVLLTANYTWTDSSVSAGANDQVTLYNGSVLAAPLVVRDGSPMQGQSDHLANLSLGLEAANGDQLTLLLGYASERIAARGTFDAAGVQRQPALMQDPGLTLDLVARKNFTLWDVPMSLSLEARNLLGEQYHEYQQLGGGRVDVNRYQLGRSVGASLQANF